MSTWKYVSALGVPCNNKKHAVLGRGCFGRTYRMRHDVDGRTCAVKQVVHGALVNEAVVLARLPPHDHVVRYYDCRIIYRRLWIIMELVGGGETVHPGIHSAWATTIVNQVADALVHIHHHGIVHRDVKHGNLLVRPGKLLQPIHIVLADFGLATGGRAPLARGHLVYRPPEAIHSTASDVWQLGVLALELGNGVKADDMVGNSKKTGYRRTIASARH